MIGDTHNISHLSPRERECLLWSALGKTTKEIASILDLADSTVNEYIAGAMKKLGATTRAQAVAIVVDAGFRTSENPPTT